MKQLDLRLVRVRAFQCYKEGKVVQFILRGLTSRTIILVPRGSNPSGLRQELRPLAASNTRSLRFTDSLSNMINLIGWTTQNKYSAHAQKLGSARGLDSWRRPEGSRPLRTRMAGPYEFSCHFGPARVSDSFLVCSIRHVHLHRHYFQHFFEKKKRSTDLQQRIFWCSPPAKSKTI